jgi:hypothetical protein
LDCGRYPTILHLDFCLDLGVLAMLRLTRANPTPEDPEAALAGFLNLQPLWVMQNQKTEQWSEPQGGLHYRWVAIYWRVGAEHQPDPFRKRTITLASSDELFGEELREYFDSLATVPPAVLQNLGEGVSVEDRLREAGYVDAAAKLERFAAAARAWE